MENGCRLIDANALWEEVEKSQQYNPHVDGRVKLNHRQEHDHFLRMIYLAPTVDAVEVVHAYWEDGVCSNCKEEALYTSWDEPIYEYDWEENLRYSHTDTHKEHHLTDYCPNCGAKMDGGNEDG